MFIRLGKRWDILQTGQFVISQEEQSVKKNKVKLQYGIKTDQITCIHKMYIVVIRSMRNDMYNHSLV